MLRMLRQIVSTLIFRSFITYKKQYGCTRLNLNFYDGHKSVKQKKKKSNIK